MIANNVMFVNDSIEPLMKEVLGKILVILENEQSRNFASSVKISRDSLHFNVINIMAILVKIVSIVLSLKG